MRKLNMLKKLIVLSLVFLIGFYQVPLSVLANTTVETESLEEELEVLEEEIVRVVISDGDTVDLYAEPSTESEIVHLIPHESEVTLVIDEDDYSETEHDFSKVEFVSINESDENEYFLGFIENDYLYTLDEVESVKENKEDEQTDSALIDEDNNSVEEDSTEQVLESDEQNVDSSEEEKEQEEIDTEEDDEEEFTEMSIASIQSNSSAETLNGVALKDRTPVYSEQSTSSTVLRDYSQGTILLYQSLNSTWYQALVILNGVRTTGYIHRDDVETLDLSNQQSLQGLSKLNSTHVYSQPSTSSSTLRSYNAGRLLMYKTFSNEWYEAVVIINGQQQTGYIHKDHVETFDRSNQQSLQGLSSRDKTHVYSQPSTSSSALRSYSPGRLL
ncbi:hypothetical protein JOE23_003365, partial [Amphibacillus cookii]|nr:hypothetical protein [Amphibacillus cookii]